ncbi:hypothetical protein BC829DRAFT_435426 [Chytridium lagenaria]|nr:hypothetical protein BC829DRAFT_435426 [Chytridium lagenaria]
MKLHTLLSILPLFTTTAMASIPLLSGTSILETMSTLPSCTLPCLDWFLASKTVPRIDKFQSAVEMCWLTDMSMRMFEMCTFASCGHDDLVASRKVRLEIGERCYSFLEAVKDFGSFSLIHNGTLDIPTAEQSAASLTSHMSTLTSCQTTCFGETIANVSTPVTSDQATAICGSGMLPRTNYMSCTLVTCKNDTQISPNMTEIQWLSNACAQTLLPNPPRGHIRMGGFLRAPADEPATFTEIPPVTTEVPPVIITTVAPLPPPPAPETTVETVPPPATREETNRHRRIRLLRRRHLPYGYCYNYDGPLGVDNEKWSGVNVTSSINFYRGGRESVKDD